ncbi:hypothetical protein [Paenibacillus piri]|uniref:Uncharacterized protein n=1 Tax=Paenibacillus piri TaxID=2547395 RepID=A0A4R5KUI4_9BACL|nr:hypothetical protein [Paenibacillus piri]TDF99579.1 hypothetical protein E1757_07005 [Paenibacillus piri]
MIDTEKLAILVSLLCNHFLTGLTLGGMQTGANRQLTLSLHTAAGPPGLQGVGLDSHPGSFRKASALNDE